jgi:uncharacterized protein (TIGR00268 family)
LSTITSKYPLFVENEKVATLTQILKNLGEPLFIACSGGLDSRFLAFFAKYIGIENIKLLHITGVHIDTQESQALHEWAKLHQFSLHTIALDILDDEAIKNNALLRCYHCKHKVFSAMLSFCNHKTLCDGTHFEDTNSHRPGLKALQELHICSPLMQSGFTKTDIKNIAKEIGLDNPSQKAKPCLLTRFNYGASITKEKLEKLLTSSPYNVVRSKAISKIITTKAAESFKVISATRGLRNIELWIEKNNSVVSDEIKMQMKWLASLKYKDERIALEQRELVKSVLESILDEKTLILMPTTANTAPPRTASDEQLYKLNTQILKYTSLASLADLPQLHLPWFSVNNSPWGISLIGQKGMDRQLIDAAIRWKSNQ